MDKILKILRGLHGDVDFQQHQALIDEAVLDSFDIISIVASLSEQFGVSVPPEEIIPENFNSAEALWNMVQRLMEE
jgi:acyl carrier protein